MTASRTATSRYNQTNQSNNSNNILAKRTRGPINKRACQRCRQGKIKCDGDAETGKPCSNCDPQHCKYDNSPRKNKQVESLKIRLTAVENDLITITRDVSEKLNTKDMEKEILCLLYESKEHFMNSTQNIALFQDLRNALKESRCIRPILAITYELLTRLASVENIKYVPNIMESLQRFVDCASAFEKDASINPTVSSSVDIFKKIEENYLSQPYPNDNILPTDQPSMMSMPISLPLDNDQVDISHLNLHSTDDSGSETHSNHSRGGGRYEFNDEGPSAPRQQQQQQQQSTALPESKCYNTNNGDNVSHQLPNPMIATSTALLFPNDVYAYDYNYSYNFYQSTSSPTDESAINNFL